MTRADAKVVAWALFPAAWLAGCSGLVFAAGHPWLSGFAGGLALCIAIYVGGRYLAGDL